MVLPISTSDAKRHRLKTSTWIGKDLLRRPPKSASISPTSPVDVELEKETRSVLIGRLKDTFRKGKDDSFNPKVLSIGPLHHGKKDLKELEEVKDRIVAKFWTEDLPKDVSDLIESEVFYSYPRYIQERHRSFDSKYFVNMIFRDACVVLYIVDVCANSRSSSDLLPNGTLELCIRDLMLLENQLPWALLDLLNTKKFGKKKGQQNVIKFLYAFMNRSLSESSFSQVPKNLFDDAPHLVGLLRELCLLSYSPPSKYPFFAYSAKELDEKGVKLKGIEPKENKGLLVGRMEFSWLKATLVIPAFTIHDEAHFRQLFMNMIAYECTPGVKTNAEITTLIHAYAALLRDSSSVAIGKDRGFIFTRFDNETIVALFKDMSENSFPGFDIYADAKVPQLGFVCKLRVWGRDIYETFFYPPSKIILGLLTVGGAAAAYLRLAKGIDSEGKGQR